MRGRSSPGQARRSSSGVMSYKCRRLDAGVRMIGSSEILAAIRELSNTKQLAQGELHGLLEDGIKAALAKKHGPAVVDEAAKAALDLGVPTYRFLRRYLERRLPAPLTLRQVDPLIRQLTLYRDLIDRKTGDTR